MAETSSRERGFSLIHPTVMESNDTQTVSRGIELMHVLLGEEPSVRQNFTATFLAGLRIRGSIPFPPVYPPPRAFRVDPLPRPCSPPAVCPAVARSRALTARHSNTLQ